MSDLRVIAVLAGGAELPSLSSAAAGLPGLRLRACTRDDLFDQRAIDACIAQVAESEALIVIPMGGAASIPGCERLRSEGLDAAVAERQASLRVFSEKPGTHGAGIDHLLQSGQWQRTEELGETWTAWGGYAYGQGMYGRPDPAALRRRLAGLDCTVQNLDSREYDILSMDDVMLYHGGMNAAVKAAGGQAASYSGDGDDPRRIRMRSTAEEARLVFRTRLLNPRWIAGMQRHGFKGAGDMAAQVEYAAQWDATSGILDDWQYERLADTYALDPAMQDFLRRHNPDALHHIAETLLDADGRGLWEQPGERRDQLQDVLLQAEAGIEDRISTTEAP